MSSLSPFVSRCGRPSDRGEGKCGQVKDGRVLMCKSHHMLAFPSNYIGPEEVQKVEDLLQNAKAQAERYSGPPESPRTSGYHLGYHDGILRALTILRGGS